MTRYLYDWADLPAIPESDYTYHIITYSPDEKQYALVQLVEPFIVRSSYIVLKEDYARDVYLTKSSYANWFVSSLDIAEGNADYAKLPDGYYFVWANHDLIDENGYIIYSATEPTAYEVDVPTPIITEHGENATYAHGHPAASLICRAKLEDRGELSFKWYRNDVAYASGAKCNPTTSTLGSDSYKCAVTNTLFGLTNTIYSDPVTITTEVGSFCPISFSAGMALGADLAGWDISGVSTDGSGNDPSGGTENATTYLYGDKQLKLAALPEATMKAFPYAFIRYLYSGYILIEEQLWLSTSPLVINGDYISTRDREFIYYCQYDYDTNPVRWSLLQGTGTYDISVYMTGNLASVVWDGLGYHEGSCGMIYWTNFDLYDTDGNLLMAASDPVPVYE